MKSLGLVLVLIFSFVCISYAVEKRYNIPIDGSPFVGPEKAPVTIVEFIDYQ